MADSVYNSNSEEEGPSPDDIMSQGEEQTVQELCQDLSDILDPATSKDLSVQDAFHALNKLSDSSAAEYGPDKDFDDQEDDYCLT